MIIRKMEEKDIEQVVDIQIGGWRTAYKGIIDEEFLDNMNREEKINRRRNTYNQRLCIVAEDDREVVGFCNYYDRNDEDFLEYDAEIMALYVRPDKKNHGIGSLMFEYVRDYFKLNGKNKMILWCLKENYPSRGFYEKMGGKIVGEKQIEFGGKNYDEVGFGYDLQETTIREFEAGDGPQVSQIVTRNLLEVNAKDYGKEMMEEHAKQFSKEQILETFKDRIKIFAAEKNGEIFGTAGLAEDWSKEKGSYCILTVFVKPENQGQGIGRKLIEDIEEFAKTINAKKLTVPASIAGHQFYYKLGYRYKDDKKVLNEEGMYIMQKML